MSNTYAIYLAMCQDKKFKPFRYRVCVHDLQYDEIILMDEQTLETKSPAVAAAMMLAATLDDMIPLVADSGDLSIFINSGFVVDAYNKWLPGWKRNGWKGKNGSPLATREWFEKIDVILQQAEHPSIQKLTEVYLDADTRLADLRPYFDIGYGEAAEARAAQMNTYNSPNVYNTYHIPPPPAAEALPMLPGMGSW